MLKWMDAFRSEIPEGEVGKWRVEKFEVTPADQIIQLGGFFRSGRIVPPGEYTRLVRNNRVIMSDTPDEIRDHREAYLRAEGRVLIFGLGLGCYLKAALLKPEVSEVRVVEIDPDVIELVGKHFADPRLTIFCADAYEYKPVKGERWNAVWFDIWDNMCEDNLDEMAKLHRRWGRYADWKGSWGREALIGHRRRSRAQGWY